mgnify:CR=1 FL=1
MTQQVAGPPTAPELGREDALQVLHRQAEVLEMVAEGRDLKPTLASIAAALEELMPGARCSILLFNPVSATLHHGAAPSLPPEYIDAIDGMGIGPTSGSCGTAAYTGVSVVAESIDDDPRWDDFRAFAVPHDLHSCWSTPISGRQGISGTFAVYHAHSHRPTAREELLVQRFTHLASVAIDHDHLFGALVESEERFRHAFQDNAIGMALVSLDGSIVKVNRALRHMLQLPESALLAMDFDQIVEPTDPETTGPLWDGLVSGAQMNLHFSATASPRIGGRLRLAVDASVIRDAVGDPVVVGVNLLDVTHRHAAEEERRARREADVARRIAESASRNKSDFVAAMSHDIRTPLQSIAGFTEMLRTMDLDSDRRQTALGHIARATGHITELVDDVLDIARIEAGSLPLRMDEVALDDVMDATLSITAPLAEARAVAVHTVESDAIVRADELRLRQVLLNLVTNAISYNRPGGSVVIGSACRADRVEVRITNTGEGIPQDRLDRLFVPFDRLGAEGTGVPGVGLGLTLALGLTEAMGGTLAVDSVPGEGTTVTLTLRLAGQ